MKARRFPTYCSWKSSIGGSNRIGLQFPRYRDTLEEKNNTVTEINVATCTFLLPTSMSLSWQAFLAKECWIPIYVLILEGST